MENVIIIGSGPAGHTAAIYTARANLYPLMYEGMMAGGISAGGQLTTTTDIENFPGFPEGISGAELMNRMREQSIKCGTRIETATVDKIDIREKPFKIFQKKESLKQKVSLLPQGRRPNVSTLKMKTFSGKKAFQHVPYAMADCPFSDKKF